MQTKLRTIQIEPNENISFPIGTLFAVTRLYEILNFTGIFGKHKKNGIDINKLIMALVSYKLTDNFSIKRSHEWINRPEVLAEFGLPSFSERTLYRVLEILGANRDAIISDIQDVLFERYDFEHTDINMDWTSIVLHGTEARLGKYGYSRDHRPDKKQITVGVTELADPINIPIGMTIEPGNLNDQTHFKKTYQQSRGRLREGSLVIFDKGANSVANTQMIRADHLQYITGKKLNKNTGISADELLANYKGQGAVERGFRFLKDKSFRVAEVFLKKVSRIQALAMIMVLCLFIYAITEFRLRRELKRSGETVTSQTKKQTQRPTMKWTFFLFRRVREFVVIEDGRRVKRVTNLNEELRKILGLLGSEYEKYHS